ncbi:PP2C family protein-serine/threonine phosphatase [Agromyces seonyuensis]|uniref:Serine/threonine-protein phosphatase n=1 Tax=Agromyces seonyuensis TaxID=2662446 RepID=A0A6I4NT05_9MICO|nr:protein phosphatase 2C domain-containing protein [Agromyces seonyuensis]MWB97596.1 serine/threonine-protein phosphatase [Agromyces seonyuensis]
MSLGVVLDVAALTDPGLKRKVNEDSVLAVDPVFVVADGMGGYEAGDRASAAVVAAFREHLAGRPDAELVHVRDALMAADVGVQSVAAGTKRGAGSTVSGIVLVEHEGLAHWLILNVGDSRVYRWYAGELEQLTVDHSLVQELVDDGSLTREEMQTQANRNVITRAIGAPDSTADSWLMPVVDGERLLVCTDGLHSEVADEGIRATLTMNGRPEQAAAALVQLAKRAGGRDNITVVVLDVRSGGVPEEPGFDDEDDATLETGPRGTEFEDDTLPVGAAR